MFVLMRNGYAFASFTTRGDAAEGHQVAVKLDVLSDWTIDSPVLCGSREVPRYIVAAVRTLKQRAPGQFSIACIKLIREHMQSGLKEAKDAFDAI